MNVDFCIYKCICTTPNQFRFLTLTKEQATSSSSIMYIQMDILEYRFMHMQVYIHYRIKYDTNLEVKAPSVLSTLLE